MGWIISLILIWIWKEECSIDEGGIILIAAGIFAIAGAIGLGI